MPGPNSFRDLLDTLRSAGVRVHEGEGFVGFPLVLNLPAWPPVVLDVPDPGVLSLFDPSTFGLAIVEPSGAARVTWGIAQGSALFARPEALLESPVGAVIDDALQGRKGSVFLDGCRFYASAYEMDGKPEAIVLVAKADDEAAVREASQGHLLSTIALKRIGKALSSKQSLRSLALPALHAIYGTYELAAALLWVRTDEDGPLSLLASIGTNRALTEINVLAEGSTCIAALAVRDRHPMLLKDVRESPLTSGVEATICTSDPGAALVLPLMSATRLVGVLELVGRRGDKYFVVNEEIFATIAEHLALAVHNAILFENAERLAAHDPLTGIANHRRLHEFLSARLNEAKRGGEKVAVVMIDVDHFRRFNEESGHDAGDRVLKQVAKALSSCVREYDLAARYGGEEFTLILGGVTVDQAFAIAERARLAVEALESGVTASFGCAVFPDMAFDAASVLKAADQALYDAKRLGRNRTVVFGRSAA